MSGMSEKIYDAHGVKAWRENGPGLQSQPSDEQSDALTVARWCAWDCPPGFVLVSDKTFALAVFDPEEWAGSDGAKFGIHDAEQVVLARGLAEQYARAAYEDNLDLYPCDGSGEADFTAMAQLMMLPLSARLRALAKVARENP